MLLNGYKQPTNDSGLQIHEDSSWYMFAGASLAEEGVEWLIAGDHLVTGYRAIGLDAVLQAVQLPAGIADLDSCLAEMDANTLPLSTQTSGYMLKNTCHI